MIEHSLGQKKPVTKSFASFAKAEEWLKGREREELPSRNNNALKRCKNGVCTFDVSSLLHNNLYIKRVTYAASKRGPYIRVVTLLDGD